MKVRAANLRDLGSIEAIYNDGRHLAPTPPPARLWSLVSHTLAAILPMYPESLLYVAESNGRVIGFIQAAVRPSRMKSPLARSLQVLNLCVADSADDGEIAQSLIDQLCRHAQARGVLKVFVRMPLDDPLAPAFRGRAFRQYAIEHVLFADSVEPVSAPAPAGLRPTRGRDHRLVYQLYRKVTPPAVAVVEGRNYSEWRAARDDAALHGGGAVQEFVVDQVEVVGWLRVQHSSSTHPHALSLLCLPEGPLPRELVDHALSLVGPSAPVWTSLRHYDHHLFDAFYARGFNTLVSQSLMVRELALKATLAEKVLVPSFG